MYAHTLTVSSVSVLIHTQSPVDRPTLRSVIVSSPRGRTRITRRKLYGQPPLPTITAAQVRPCCSLDNNHGCQHVVGRDPDTHHQIGRTLDVVTGFQASHPSENTPRPKGRVRTAAILSTGILSSNGTTGGGLISASNSASISRPPDRISTSLNDIGLSLQRSPKWSRHGILLRLGGRDLTRTCLLMGERGHF